MVYTGYTENPDDLKTAPHSYSAGKESTCNAGDPRSISGSGKSAAEGIGYPLQYSRASFVDQLVKNRLQYERPGFNP